MKEDGPKLRRRRGSKIITLGPKVVPIRINDIREFADYFEISTDDKTPMEVKKAVLEKIRKKDREIGVGVRWRPDMYPLTYRMLIWADMEYLIPPPKNSMKFDDWRAKANGRKRQTATG
jgi:hypothetical protein